MFAAPPATAKPIEKERFHDVGVSEVFDCDGTPAQDEFNVRGHFTAKLRGSSPFPYFKEHVQGRVSTINLDTGGAYTNRFTANSKDHRIVNNGDGTITITVRATGSSRWYDQFGNPVLKDTGIIRFAIDIDFNGTPSDPSDDTEVPDSFRLLHDTGRNDTAGRDFCEDLVLFTS